MQFLDAIGLASFWNKIKNWVNINYLSLKGGTINGEVNISGNVSALQFKKTNGTSTQVLIADGSVKGINSANGVAGLDSNGNIPLSHLGNLDTTVAEVVTALPTTNIKKHIYLIKDADGATQDKYEEYIYTGDTSATYDASKWEKLGDFRAVVDLKNYAKKIDTIKSLTFENRGSDLFLAVTTGSDTHISDPVPAASSSTDGTMSATDKIKLDGIEAHANNYSLPLATAATRGGIKVGYAANGRNYPVQMDGEKAYVNVPWTDTNTTYDLSPYAKKTEAVKNVVFRGVESDGSQISNTASRNLVYTLGDGSEKVVDVPLAEPRTTGGRPYPGQNGFMRSSDKAKLDGIADGANNYTLPTASASVLGGILIGYGTSGRNYAVLLDGSGKAYVNVPWTDTNTTYDLSPYAKTADVNKALAKKVDVVSGKGLSTEDFTTALKTKLNGIATGATADSAIPISVIDALN